MAIVALAYGRAPLPLPPLRCLGRPLRLLPTLPFLAHAALCIFFYCPTTRTPPCHTTYAFLPSTTPHTHALLHTLHAPHYTTTTTHHTPDTPYPACTAHTHAPHSTTRTLPHTRATPHTRCHCAQHTTLRAHTYLDQRPVSRCWLFWLYHSICRQTTRHTRRAHHCALRTRIRTHALPLRLPFAARTRSAARCTPLHAHAHARCHHLRARTRARDAPRAARTHCAHLCCAAHTRTAPLPFYARATEEENFMVHVVLHTRLKFPNWSQLANPLGGCPLASRS